MAERLSDKLQIMMVPADGKFFFANDVLRSMNMSNQASQSEQGEGQTSALGGGTLLHPDKRRSLLSISPMAVSKQ